MNAYFPNKIHYNSMEEFRAFTKYLHKVSEEAEEKCNLQIKKEKENEK